MEEIYNRAKESSRPTLVLSIAKPFESLESIMTNACLHLMCAGLTLLAVIGRNIQVVWLVKLLRMRCHV